MHTVVPLEYSRETLLENARRTAGFPVNLSANPLTRTLNSIVHVVVMFVFF